MIVKGELHTVTVQGTICAMSTDNLGANVLGRFKEYSSALHGCRHCLTTHEYILIKLTNSL